MNESFKHSRAHSAYLLNQWLKRLDDWTNKRMNGLSEEKGDEKVNLDYNGWSYLSGWADETSPKQQHVVAANKLPGSVPIYSLR